MISRDFSIYFLRSFVIFKIIFIFLPENSTREDLDKLELASQDQSGFMKVLKRCKDTSELTAECICRTEVCISWYPCQLKYCQGQDDNGQPMEYRCGIKTCGKCHDFDFYVGERRHCFWDVNSQPFSPFCKNDQINVHSFQGIFIIFLSIKILCSILVGCDKELY